MKKIICLIVLILFISICMVSCSSYNQTGTDSYTRSTLTSYEARGLSSYNQNDKRFDLCNYTVPKEWFDAYEYLEGDYFYISSFCLFAPDKNGSKALLYFRYDAESYALARDYLLSLVSVNEPISFNEYTFHEILSLNGNLHNSDTASDDQAPTLPKHYSLIGYNDELNIVIFIGKIDDRECALPLEKHIEEYYCEWYNFQ